ncbi:MAG: restriction endonuclease subunit M [Candidatus Coatesbacteria bacterium]|nr:restriction endonuclease subunit M [Candidatus Coatesbacteria bacterium]
MSAQTENKKQTELLDRTLFLDVIEKGKQEGLLSFNEDRSKIIYHCKRDYTTSFKNPEETIRAYYYTELVLDYQYPKKRIDLEVLIPKRLPEDRADIVVYEDDDCLKPYITVEAKREGITDAEFNQAIEQVFGNAVSIASVYAVVIAGFTKRSFKLKGFPPLERKKNIIAVIPKKYEKEQKYTYIKGDAFNDLKIVKQEDLKNALKKSHDTVWEGGKRDPTSAFDEVSKLIFCKLKDEKDTKKGEPYKFQIGSHELASEVSDRIRKIYEKARERDAEVFKESINLEDEILFSVVNHIQEISFSKTELDIKGEAFEEFMQGFFKGQMGQFFTPRKVVDFCVNMMSPDKDALILDPACGSGGFLLNCLEHVKKRVEQDYEEEAYNQWHEFAKNNLFGIEVNEKIARVCKMNMIIHDDGHTNIISTDALKEIENKDKNIKGIIDLNKKIDKNSFDLILTNPPFGATIKRSEKSYLNNYNLGKNKKNQKTEILFIERVIEFVKPVTGRIAIVLPDGILTNSSLQYVRDFIMEKCQILAIVSLPQTAFSYYGAGVKASLVFLRKKGDYEMLEDYPIFMAIAEKIGYDATGREIPENDFSEILKAYKNFKEHKHPF